MEAIANKQHEELRDKFAAAALTALLTHVPPNVAFARSDKHTEQNAHDKLATEAYRWADAMLRARNQGSSELP